MFEKEIKERIMKHWDNANDVTSHLRPASYLESEEFMMNRFKALITEKGINVNDRTVIDFGCGGGYCGRYLLENFNLKKYIAMDIANVAINRAREQLEKYENASFVKYDIDKIPEFKEFNPYLFVAFAVIIHFPTKEFLHDFLEKVNRSGAEKLILEIRDGGIGTKFREEVYKTYSDGRLGCITNEKYISKKLSNYVMVDKTDPQKAPTDCQVIWYERRK